MATQLSGPVSVVGQAMHSSSATRIHNLGELVHANDGRSFRYVEAGAAALVSGNVLQAKAENTSDQALAVAAAAIDATTVVTTTTVTVDANEYANGWIVVAVTPGFARQYKILSHPAASTAALTITLSDPIAVALTTSSRIDLVANPYQDVIQQPTTRTSASVGIAVQPIALDEFGWIGVGGPHAVLADGALTVGLHVTSSDATAGAVEVIADGATELLPPIGRCLSGVATTEAGIIHVALY